MREKILNLLDRNEALLDKFLASRYNVMFLILMIISAMFLFCFSISIAGHLSSPNSSWNDLFCLIVFGVLGIPCIPVAVGFATEARKDSIQKKHDMDAYEALQRRRSRKRLLIRRLRCFHSSDARLEMLCVELGDMMQALDDVKLDVEEYGRNISLCYAFSDKWYWTLDKALNTYEHVGSFMSIDGFESYDKLESPEHVAQAAGESLERIVCEAFSEACGIAEEYARECKTVLDAIPCPK